MPDRTKIIFLISLVAVIVYSIFVFVPPIPQPLSYHNFADRRVIADIPYFGDVVSNILFILVGFSGLAFLIKQIGRSSANFINQREKFLWLSFFLSSILIGLGSGFYHLNPTNSTLVWDRLPMTLAFMALTTIMIEERINNGTLTLIIFLILLLVGVFSVIYWNYTEQQGVGDLRAYGLVQFLPFVIIPFLIILFPPRYDNIGTIIKVFSLSLIARFGEHFDTAIYTFSQNFISGHTVKHIAFSGAVYVLLLHIKKRRI
jgi:hypothetical protein